MADPASTALMIDLILEKILEHSDFEDLKVLRLVNKYWNKIACPALRKRSNILELGGWDADLCQVYSVLANHDIAANIPVRYKAGMSMERIQPLNDVTWLKIVSVTQVKVTVADANRVTPFLLRNLPYLKELKLEVFGCEKDEFKGITAPALVASERFSLESVGYSTCTGNPIDTAHDILDPLFMVHCPKLQTFAFEENYFGNSPRIAGLLPSFFSQWKRMILESADVPRFSIVKFTLFPFPLRNHGRNHHQLDRLALLEALIEFINMNQPTSLELTGNFNYDFPTVFPKIGKWTPAIQHLTIVAPFDVGTGSYQSELLFRLLKKVPAFEHLKAIHLLLSRLKPIRLMEHHVTGLTKHGLSSVVSLKISAPNGISWTKEEIEDTLKVLKQMSYLLPNVNVLQFKDKYGWYMFRESIRRREVENYFLRLFRTCCLYNMSLSQLVLDVNVNLWNNYRGQERDLKHMVEAIKAKPQIGGYLKDLKTVTSLKAVQVVVRTEFMHTAPANKEETLVALFHGYEPCVSLDLISLPAHDWNLRSEMPPRNRMKFSAKMFKEALKEAERKLGII